jgi:hypothetical protein
MVEYLRCLSLVESEMEGQSGNEGSDTHVDHHVWPVTMSVRVEGIVSQLITIGLIMGVWLVNNQVGVRVGGENVLVTIELIRIQN